MNTIETEKKRALVLLIKSMMDQLNEVASLKRQGSSAALSMGLLRETGSVLRELTPQLQTTYFNLLIALAPSMGDTPMPQVSPEYVEYSVQAKRRFVVRIRGELELRAA